MARQGFCQGKKTGARLFSLSKFAFDFVRRRSRRRRIPFGLRLPQPEPGDKIGRGRFRAEFPQPGTYLPAVVGAVQRHLQEGLPERGGRAFHPQLRLDHRPPRRHHALSQRRQECKILILQRNRSFRPKLFSALDDGKIKILHSCSLSGDMIYFPSLSVLSPRPHRVSPDQSSQ